MLELRLEDWRWRIDNLYWIIDEYGQKLRFKPNAEQREFLASFHYLNIILKARQLGFTTLIDILLLDQCFFVPNTTAGIIAHNLDDAGKIFRNKVRFAHDNLPDALRKANPLTRESESELVWANGSQISVATSMRSGTLQYLHVSEYGKIARRDPLKSREIRTGSFNAVHAGQFIFVESTAEGRGGDFYEMVDAAQKERMMGQRLSDMDWKLHFYPWWRKAEYAVSARDVTITVDMRDYFAELAKDHGINLTDEQKAWYVKKSRDMKGDMKREFPSHEAEAFEAANEEKYYGKQMDAARKSGRVKVFPIIPDRPVNVYFDIGLDMTSMWFHQYCALEHRMIDFYQNSGEELSHFVRLLQSKPYIWGTFYLPFDAEDGSAASKLSFKDRLVAAMPGVRIHIVTKTKDRGQAIDATRAKIAEVYFHSENCAAGITCLDMYRKRWNETTGMWMDDPLHDKYSHGADAFRQFVQGWEETYESSRESRYIAGPAFAGADRDTGY